MLEAVDVASLLPSTKGLKVSAAVPTALVALLMFQLSAFIILTAICSRKAVPPLRAPFGSRPRLYPRAWFSAFQLSSFNFQLFSGVGRSVSALP